MIKDYELILKDLMSNIYYSDSLIGKTVSEAYTFLEENIVYLNASALKYRITELREFVPKGIYTSDYCENRLWIVLKNEIIVEVGPTG